MNARSRFGSIAVGLSMFYERASRFEAPRILRRRESPCFGFGEKFIYIGGRGRARWRGTTTGKGSMADVGQKNRGVLHSARRRHG